MNDRKNIDAIALGSCNMDVYDRCFTQWFKHYYNRFAEEEDMNDGTVTQVSIVSETKKKGRKK